MAEGPRHGDADVKKISAVVYLTDGDPDPNNISGGTFAIPYDGQGNTHDLATNPIEETCLSLRVQFLGCYPVRENKRVFVVDYFYEDK